MQSPALMVKSRNQEHASGAGDVVQQAGREFDQGNMREAERRLFQAGMGGRALALYEKIGELGEAERVATRIGDESEVRGFFCPTPRPSKYRRLILVFILLVRSVSEQDKDKRLIRIFILFRISHLFTLDLLHLFVWSTPPIRLSHVRHLCV